MFDVYFYNFGKRLNSFAQPSGTGANVPCKLKAGTSILKPVLEIEQSVTTQNSVRNINYCYIPDFARYYYIDNWTLNGALAIASCHVDPLASHKTAVLSQSFYVLRSASSYDGFIKDTRYPVKASNPQHGTNSYQNVNPLAPAVNDPTGIFVLGIVSSETSITGCVQYYAMSITDTQYFMSQLFNLPTQWGTGGTDLADGLKKAITDPMQYIVSAIWFPWTMQDFVNHALVDAVQSIKVGYDTITLSGYAGKFKNVIDVEFTNVISITKPTHPLSTSRGAYMDYEPYSRYYLSFYPFCTFCELDSTLLPSTIYLVYTVDLRNGKGILHVSRDYTGSSWADWRPQEDIRCFESQVGVEMPVASIHTSIPSTISEYVQNFAVSAVNEFGGFQQTAKNVVDTASNWVMGKLAKLTGSEELADAVADAETQVRTVSKEDVSTIASNAAAMKSTLEMIGSLGTMSFYDKQVISLWSECYTPVEESLALNGRPLCAVRQLSTLSGFVLVDNPRVQLTGAFTSEIVEIENALASGAFIQ